MTEKKGAYPFLPRAPTAQRRIKKGHERNHHPPDTKPSPRSSCFFLACVFGESPQLHKSFFSRKKKQKIQVFEKVEAAFFLHRVRTQRGRWIVRQKKRQPRTRHAAPRLVCCRSRANPHLVTRCFLVFFARTDMLFRRSGVPLIRLCGIEKRQTETKKDGICPWRVRARVYMCVGRTHRVLPATPT